MANCPCINKPCNDSIDNDRCKHNGQVYWIRGYDKCPWIPKDTHTLMVEERDRELKRRKRGKKEA